MKFLLILIIPLLFTINAKEINEFKIDIWFGNGVGNTNDMATISKGKLQIFIEDNNITNSPNFDYILAYNWTGSSPKEEDIHVIYDLVETFFMIDQSGQSFSIVNAINHLIYGAPESEKNSDFYKSLIKDDNLTKEKIDNLKLRTEDVTNLNTDIMIKNYRDRSLNKYHRIIGVAHSQGNLFMNKAISGMTDKEKNYFKMIGLGVAADNIQGVYEGNNPSYITLDCDKVIGFVTSSLSSNTECKLDSNDENLIGLSIDDKFLEHGFDAYYLNEPDSKVKLINYLKESIIELNLKDSRFTIKSEDCNITASDENNSKVTINHLINSSGKIFKIGEKFIMDIMYSTDLNETLKSEDNNCSEKEIINGELTVIYNFTNYYEGSTILSTLTNIVSTEVNSTDIEANTTVITQYSNLEDGNYSLHVINQGSVIESDLIEISSGSKIFITYDVDLHEYTMQTEFSESMIAGKSFKIHNVNTPENNVTITFNNDFTIKENNGELPFTREDWRIEAGELITSSTIFGLELGGTFKHLIVGYEEGCYLTQVNQVNSGWNEAYKWCP